MIQFSNSTGKEIHFFPIIFQSVGIQTNSYAYLRLGPLLLKHGAGRTQLATWSYRCRDLRSCLRDMVRFLNMYVRLTNPYVRLTNPYVRLNRSVS